MFSKPIFYKDNKDLIYFMFRSPGRPESDEMWIAEVLSLPAHKDLTRWVRLPWCHLSHFQGGARELYDPFPPHVTIPRSLTLLACLRADVAQPPARVLKSYDGWTTPVQAGVNTNLGQKQSQTQTNLGKLLMFSLCSFYVHSMFTQGRWSFCLFYWFLLENETICSPKMFTNMFT